MALHVLFCMLLGNTAVNVIYLNKEGKIRMFGNLHLSAESCKMLFHCVVAC